MGGEDFSRYGKQGVPICMFKLGSVLPDRLEKLTEGGAQAPSLHSAKYFPDPELTLRTGITAMVAVVQDILPSKQ